MIEKLKERISRRSESIHQIRSRREANICLLKDQISDAKSIVTTLRKQNRSQALSNVNRSDILKRTRKNSDSFAKEQWYAQRNAQNCFRINNRSFYNSKSTTCYNSMFSHRRTHSVSRPITNINNAYSPQASTKNLVISKQSEDGVDSNISQSLIDSTNFSIIIHKEFMKYKISDYENFNYLRLVDENVKLKKYLTKYFNDSQIQDLLKHKSIWEFEKGEIIKEQNVPYNCIFIIVTGKMGIYLFPNDKRKLMWVLKSRDLVGEYDMNFIAPKSAEYEALTKMTVIKISKEDYNRAMNDTKVVFRNSTARKLTKQFSIFSDVLPEDLIHISKRVKQKKFDKNECVTFEGCLPDCIYLVGEGEFRAEKEISYKEK